MRSQTLTILLAIFIFNALAAQNPSFDFSAKVLYAPIQENTISNNINFSRTTSINDSTGLQSFFAATNRTTKEYKLDLGYELTANINFPINDKLKIRTGLGLNLNSLSIGFKGASIINETLLSTDTISFRPNTSPLSPSSFCERSLNSPSDFAVDPDVALTLINLRIPFIASIYLLDSKLRLNLGIYMQTPIDSKNFMESINLNRQMIDGEYQCEYFLHEETDTSGGNISNLLFGYSISAEYYVSKNIALEIGVLRDISNTFNNPQNATFSSNLNDLSVGRYAVGFRYLLGKR